MTVLNQFHTRFFNTAAAEPEPPPRTPDDDGGGWKDYFFGFHLEAVGLFSSRDQPGVLNTDGGWVLYIVDWLGVTCFGTLWPIVGWILLLTALTGVLALLAHSL